MYCHKCKKKLDLPSKKVGFKETCFFCEADLHVCKNCRFHLIGKPNDCLVPNTEYVSDREKYNFCEEFSFKDNLSDQETKSKKDISKKLFDEESDDDSKNDFDSLFKD
ncbi:MAG: hypothetical protein K1060chlam1_00782 [Candidatus Anoxychlamydiales bacterium]|nr:hypothetical protein [Candidatus Anoxychlamydiales bacterium]